MAEIFPFRGLRYAPAWRADLPRLVTPPYDIISTGDQRAFYRKHPHNIIRLELGKTGPADSARNNRYSRARQVLDAWLEKGVLAQEAAPALYLVESEYADPQGNRKTFLGLLGRVKLEPLDAGKILPHEKIYKGPKADRFKLLCATGVSFSPVFSLYQDPDRAVASMLAQWRRRKPDADFKDFAGFRQRLWVVTQPESVRALQAALAAKTLLIADGHHRYSTALAYRDWLGKSAGPDADSVMMVLADDKHSGLSVLPVFRLVRGIGPDRWKRFWREAENYFTVKPVAAPRKLAQALRNAEQRRRRPVLGFWGGRGKKAALLELNAAGVQVFSEPECGLHSKRYCRLDVVVLNRLILQKLLGLLPGEEKGRLHYSKDAAETGRALARGVVQAAFLPGLPKVDEIWELARLGETMPHKSTYFLPKLITGLVMNPVSKECGLA